MTFADKLPQRLTTAELDQIRLACFDIDGTLVGSLDDIGPRTLSSIKRLRARGIKVALASGRPWFGAKEIARTIEADGPSMLSSGALIIDPLTAAPLHVEGIEPQLAAAIFNRCTDGGFHCEIYGVDDYFIARENEWSQIHRLYLARDPKLLPHDFSAIGPIVKLVIMTDRNRGLQNALELQHEFPATIFAVGYGAAHPDIGFINITSIKASRLKGLEKMLQLAGGHTCGNLMAFGDAEGDLPFLEAARIGVAMGTSPHEVCAKARYVTDSAAHDGVGSALERFGF
jgi:Cof subfamily protein (haloacid dehalogenase superfamily)